MDQNKEDQSEMQKNFNFYVLKIDAFKKQTQEFYLELQKPLYELDNIQLKERSKNFIQQDKKQSLTYLCLKRLCHIPNLGVSQIQSELENRCNQQEQQYLKTLNTENENVSDLLMQILESKNFIKNNELAQNILNAKDVIFWMPREYLLKEWNITDLRLIKQIYNFRKLKQKTFQKMFEMQEKKYKIQKKEINEQGLERLKNCFNNYQNIHVKFLNECQKIKKKVYEFNNPKIISKKIKPTNIKNNKKQKEPQKKQQLKSNTNKTKVNQKKIKSSLNIETFFEKPKKKQVKKDKKKIKKYERWESIGQFPLILQNKKVDYKQLNQDTINQQALKDIFFQSKTKYKKNLSQFRLSKIEDFKKYSKEYYGLFTSVIDVDITKQFNNFTIFNYELSTEEELQHEEADTIKSDEQSQDDDINPEMESFIVGDDYMSGEEDQSQFFNFKSKNFANGNKNFQIFNLEEDQNQELMIVLEAVNLTQQKFPLLFEKKKKDQADEELKISQIQELVLQLLGCSSKKVALQMIDKSEIKKSSKEVFKYIKENCHFVYYVNPDDIQQYCKINYFQLLEQNINQQEILTQNYSSFMEYLILHLHGLSNSAQEKEERLFKKLKQSYFSTVSKSHIEKCIKKLSKFGFMVTRKFLKELVSQKEYIRKYSKKQNTQKIHRIMINKIINYRQKIFK